MNISNWKEQSTVQLRSFTHNHSDEYYTSRIYHIFVFVFHLVIAFEFVFVSVYFSLSLYFYYFLSVFLSLFLSVCPSICLFQSFSLLYWECHPNGVASIL